MKKGFTLIELLAVIIILGILLTITITAVDVIIKNSKSSLSEDQKKRLEDAAEVYYIKEGMNEEAECISVSSLINKGYINSKDVLDPNTRESLTGSVSITKDANQYTYKYEDDLVCPLTYKPQYYGSWYFSSYSEPLHIGGPLPSDKKDTPPQSDRYLGLDTSDGSTISAAYVCFNRNGNTYCLKSSDDKSDCKMNQQIIKEAFSDIIDTDKCEVSESYSICNGDDISIENSCSNIRVFNGGATCSINSGVIQCQ